MRDEARAVDTAGAFFSFLTILQKGNKRKKQRRLVQVLQRSCVTFNSISSKSTLHETNGYGDTDNYYGDI